MALQTTFNRKRMYITAKKFVRAKSFSGIVLFFATIMALILANTNRN